MIYLKDYQAPNFLITDTELSFDLNPNSTEVRSKLSISKNPTSKEDNTLKLLGENLKLIGIKIDGNELSLDIYVCNNNSLTIYDCPDKFELEIITQIVPEDNKALSGLYKSNKMYCTQCEAEGFRRITYYLDRPDVLARFKVSIYADKKSYPVLLSNGNLIDCGDLSNDRHFAIWQDPFPKPSYLFALVAGDLAVIEDTFLTKSKKQVALKLYVEHENIAQSDYALEALKKAMEWDENTYGREYDLDTYMIVAVNDFNMGAMENKGLNIFNAKYVLVSPDTATDFDYEHVDVVVGHEYFHNWSGNRVTCRDWFQLSLKEGFTVFREQQFSEDITKSSVARINQAQHIMVDQFAEAAGPLAHSVRPDSYKEINNFYTITIYEKGAEVIRMLRTILGHDKFRLGCDLYFSNFDGSAATTDDFVDSMQKASNIDLSQFKLWYSQVNTPVVDLEEHYDANNKTYTLKLRQETERALHIPVAVALLSADGSEYKNSNKILNFIKKEQEFVFDNIDAKPILSILRGFSAPIKINHTPDDKTLAFLLSHDTDDFNRWFAGQQLYQRNILYKQNDCLQLILDSVKDVLNDSVLDPALKSKMLHVPPLSQLIEHKEQIDIDELYNRQISLQKTIAETFFDKMLELYHQHELIGPYKYNSHDAGFRSLKNTLLYYLTLTNRDDAIELAYNQYKNATNMTDTISALSNLAAINSDLSYKVIEDFYTKWQTNPLVINKWLSIQARADKESTFNIVKNLTKHPSFNISNPNKVYALLVGFAQLNLYRFHVKDGSAYQFLTDKILELDKFNPQVAARLVKSLCNWKKFDQNRSQLMRECLLRVKHSDNLSEDVSELVNRALA